MGEGVETRLNKVEDTSETDYSSVDLAECYEAEDLGSVVTI